MSPTGACQVEQWGNCHDSADCCKAGLTCYRQHKWYSQCRQPGSCPADWDCVAPPTGPPVPAHCDRAEYKSCSATKCCAQGLTCYKKNKWYNQCREPGTCPAHWDCSEVAHETKGDACGCPGYRNGAEPTDHVLCKLHQPEGGKRWCEPPDTHGQCPVSKSWACGQKMRMSLLVVAAVSDLINNNFLEILAKGLKTAVTNLIMEWICPAEVCTPQCPTTKEWKVIRGCKKALKTAGRFAELLSTGEWVVEFTTPVEMAEEEAVTIARSIDTLVSDINKGNPVSPDAADVKPYILPSSELRVGAAAETDNPFDEVPDVDAPPETDASLSLPAIIAMAAGALVCVGLVGLYAVQRRRGSRYADSLIDQGELQNEMAMVMNKPEYHPESAVTQPPPGTQSASPQRSTPGSSPVAGQTSPMPKASPKRISAGSHMAGRSPARSTSAAMGKGTVVVRGSI